MGTVAIIDYGSGNLRSVEKALAHVAAEGATGHQIVVTSEPKTASRAERIVLPGVGAFADCMAGLSAIPGMIAALQEAVLRRTVPFFGICVGMQLLASAGREHGDHKGLGWIEGEVVRLAPADRTLKIPHIGWNDLKLLRPHPLTDGMAPGAQAYFVHSYHFRAADPAVVIATTDYGEPIAAIVTCRNIVATQFHPEKSQAVGLALLSRFLKWRP